jgi:Xaa-Pro aminopeptidase
MTRQADLTGARLEAVQRVRHGADAALLVVSDFASVRWICAEPVVVGTVVLVSAEQVRVVPPAADHDHLEALRAALAEARIEPVAVVAMETQAAPGRLLDLLDGHPLVDVVPGLNALRVVKDATELEVIARSAQLAADAQRRFRAELAVGRSELEVSNAIQAELAAEGRSMAAVVDLMYAERCALVGAAPTQRVLAPGETALFDCAPVVDEYWGDSCSTVTVGEPANEVRRLHATVLAALEAGIELLRPGVPIADVDRTVRAVMADGGYSYAHITGHGVGLKQQEAPIVTSDSDHVLVADTVIALEPGAYFADYGVRMEHLVHVTEDGPRLLTDHELALTTD